MLCKRQDKIMSGMLTVARQASHGLCSMKAKVGASFRMKNFTKDGRT